MRARRRVVSPSRLCRRSRSRAAATVWCQVRAIHRSARQGVQEQTAGPSRTAYSAFFLGGVLPCTTALFDRNRSPARFAAGRSRGPPAAGWPDSNAIGAANSRILTARCRHRPTDAGPSPVHRRRYDRRRADTSSRSLASGGQWPTPIRSRITPETGFARPIAGAR